MVATVTSVTGVWVGWMMSHQSVELNWIGSWSTVHWRRSTFAVTTARCCNNAVSTPMMW